MSSSDKSTVRSLIDRRKSVAAESYDPEQDSDAEEWKGIVVPKTDDQRHKVTQAVRDILLFRSLDSDQMRIITDAMFERKVKKGEVVIQQGDDGDNFYVIEEGTFTASVEESGKNPKVIKTYKDTGSFGELALLYNQARAATVTALTDGSLWAIDRITFRKILLKAAFQKRKMNENTIENVPMLKELEPYERMNLSDALVSRNIDPGERIIKEGDVADGMYFIESGKVRITVCDPQGREVEINTIGRGCYFGELALITHKPRYASAYAVGNARLAFLEVDAFERLLGPCMHIMRRNVEHYQQEMIKIFGPRAKIKELM